MKVSSKGRYALASMIILAQSKSSAVPVTVIRISEQLDISKIYLEQVFSLLRKSGLVTSIKGSQGGYRLSRSSDKITAADVLSATETSIFEDAESTVADAAPGIERAMRDSLWTPANMALKDVFERMSLSDLADEALRNPEDGYVYCI